MKRIGAILITCLGEDETEGAGRVGGGDLAPVGQGVGAHQIPLLAEAATTQVRQPSNTFVYRWRKKSLITSPGRLAFTLIWAAV